MKKVSKSLEEWREQLSSDQFQVTRHKGTERAFSGEYWNVWSDGTYHCVCCGAELFRSEAKFDAGCGWPSFHSPSAENNIETADDFSHGMHRIEVMCRQCGAHLGHVFPDGPAPTGQRYCINSLSLKLEKD